MNNNTYIKNENEIFKFLNPTDNDILYNLKGKDLQNLFTLINNYYLDTREILNIDKDITFGIEIECEHTDRDLITQKINESLPDAYWSVKSDGSLDKGAEIISPVLTDTKENWINMKKVCSIIEPLAEINDNSGGHVHIGTPILGNDIRSYINFLKLWSTYENVLFKFTYGNFGTHRPRIVKHAAPISNLFWKCSQKYKNAEIPDILREINIERYHAVNFKNAYNREKYDIHNTIEFRCPNGTLKSAIWQNNINTFVKLLNYAKSNNFDNDMIEKRHKENENIYEDLAFYNEFYIDQVLELCDTIFDNNLDKIYFLRQYLKSFETNIEYKVLNKQITRD